jgi:hypothetical protein
VCAKPGAQEPTTAMLVFTVFVIILRDRDPVASRSVVRETSDGALAMAVETGLGGGAEDNSVSCALGVAACSDGCVMTLGMGMVVVGMVMMTFELCDRCEVSATVMWVISSLTHIGFDILKQGNQYRQIFSTPIRKYSL